MRKIATHNSATGEKGSSFWGSLLYKCQTKTLEEQYASGCRMFHLRVRNVDGEWKCVNGSWVSQESFKTLLLKLNGLMIGKDKVSIIIEHDGYVPYNNEQGFIEEMSMYKMLYCPLSLLEGIAYFDGFTIALTGLKGEYREDYTDKPLPWLRRIFIHKRPFVDKCYTLTDFL